MTIFVLVPGAFHGAWCFDDLAGRLRQVGHSAFATDLPGMDGQTLPASAITLDLWSDHVTQVVFECAEPPILLGHSRGGIVVSEVAEKIPDRIVETVYLAAALLPDGTIPIHGLIKRVPEAGKTEVETGFMPPPPFAAVWATAFTGCDEHTARAAYAKLVAEPIHPLTQALNLSAKRFGSVPRTYIETLQDRAVSLDDQRTMQEALPCDRILQIDSDHSPQLSSPDDLAKILCEIADAPLRQL